MPGDVWQKFGNLRLLYGYQYTQPGKKLLFMGGEFGQWTEWNHDGQLDWPLIGQPLHDGIRLLIGDLNKLYRTEKALHHNDMSGEGFRWICADDWQNSVYCYIRQSRDSQDFVVVVLNLTPVPRQGYRVGVPVAGFYAEILNTDSTFYGGSGMGNSGGKYSQPGACHGFGQHVSLTLPPLAMLVIKPVTSQPSKA
jgi:1,4-alpha-glucan branching enzyme